MKALIWLLVLAALAAGAWKAGWLGGGDAAAPKVQFRTAKADRGEVVEGVSASGAVQPVGMVQVGTQVSGVVERILVDFNDRVTAGQTVALLDARRLQSQVAQDEAALQRAKADGARVEALIAQAKADGERVLALLEQSEKELVRQRALAERRLTAPADVEAAEAGVGSLRAQVKVSEASVRQNEAQRAVSEASVRQAEAALAGSRVNLGYATIVSPVDGVIVSRNVDVGQTVAASLSAPTLFVIATDLTKVQVQASVAEADIGRVAAGGRARFTVDAHPDRPFEGTVTQVRLQPTTVQNVVTYTVLVDASNPDSLLLPGMTATVTFEVRRSAADALRVPASALRLQPPAEIVDGAAPAAPATAGGRGRRAPGAVYLPAPGNRLRAVAVKVGISDGVLTAVEPETAGALDAGAEVVTAVVRDQAPATTNPFQPSMGRGGGRR